MSFFTKFLPKRIESSAVQSEGVLEIRDSLNLDLTDGEIVSIIDKRLGEASTIKGSIDKINERNEKFYLGDQLDESQLYEHEPRIIDNRIFLDIETITPILASKNREPIVMPAQRTDESRELAGMTRDFLSWKWSELGMNLKMADVCRFLQVHRIAVLKYYYSTENEYDDVKVEIVRPEALVIDNRPNPRFIGEYRQESVKDIIRIFATKDDGKVNKEKQDEILKSLAITDKQLDTQATFIEFWTPECVFFKLKNVILDKADNPNFLGLGKKSKKFNHFATPRMPYILFAFNTMGKGVYAETTSLEQALPLQKNVNKRKRQISNNADQASGTWIFNELYFNKKEVSKFTGAPNEHLIFKGDAGVPIREAADRLPAKDLGSQVFADLQADQGNIDNIFGVHSTTKGELTSNKTATEATLLKQSDYGRLDLISKYIDGKCKELYDALIQMAIVYYDKSKSLKILGKDGAEKYNEFNRNNIEDGIEVIVASEPLLSQAEEIGKYTQLFQAGMIDPLTMYEKMGLPNPKELTRRKLILDADPKMYLAEFAVDENTPGFEDDPKVIAKEQQDRLEEGEAVEPAPDVTRDHIKEHQLFVKSLRFKKLRDDVKELVIDHIRQEIDIMKAQMEQVRGGSTVEQPPQAGMPQGEPMPMNPTVGTEGAVANDMLQPTNPIKPGMGTG